MFISTAFAADAATTTSSAGIGSFIYLILFIAVFYFIFIRPQQKQLKRHEAQLNAIVKGSKVVVSGIVGTVVAVEDNNMLRVEIAKDTVISVIRGYVSQVVAEEKDIK